MPLTAVAMAEKYLFARSIAVAWQWLMSSISRLTVILLLLEMSRYNSWWKFLATLLQLLYQLIKSKDLQTFSFCSCG